MYILLCNFTEQGVRTIKDAPKRRTAARELAKKLGVEIKVAYLAIGPYDLVIHVEAPSDEALATYLLSLASKGNVRTTTLKVFPEAEFLPRSLDDAYRVLNVNADTPKAVIEKLVQCLRRAWHPDHGAAEDRHLRTAKLQQINAAWDIVSGKRVVAANQ